MARRFDLPALISGIHDAQHRLDRTISALTDEAMRTPSILPGWTLGHVLTHLARNAEAGTRMLDGALNERIAEQYPGGPAGRTAEIESGAGRPAAEIVEDVRATAAALDDMMRLMTPEAWERPAMFLAIGEQPAGRVPWTRWREVEIHHCDLGPPDYSPADWPRAFVDQYLRGELRRLPPRLPAGLSVTLRVEGYEGTYGPSDAKPLILTGEPWAVYAWLVGRTSLARAGLRAEYDGEPSDLIQLPAWA